ncbi:Rossmann-like and DUF2520 domain-containing protein [Parabacteroides sp. PF5-9]|uniref:Rossmann-like and DUF2520 domain-containing protein n=1 Tax=Parabacteroides sp. PF5-9 TaxID=1742404 RepID=UPI002474A449|nr:Rossmann-like and DUF2520 domain-containing protein [Parabacteroides sp. PF5-9]MDH6357267.1 putative short-subunit dehydrogenase-like oxidoreductase (DUF2520 family) [Parabacteroides sp. PF5-9]
MLVVFIGAGNLATHLALEMSRKGLRVGQVYSRTEESAADLARQLDCAWTIDPQAIRSDGDLYVFAVKDAALPAVISQLKPNNGLWVHTAGSMPMDIFKGYTSRYGVFYPLQTFSKRRSVDFSQIPVFLEAAREEDLNVLSEVAQQLSDHVEILSSEKRKRLHLAAVFANNFTNHMYVLAGKILEKEHLPIDVLRPLIDETAAKIHDMPPLQAQTGPAVRYDENVINKQLDMLTDPQMKALYQLISQNIHKEATNE